MKTWQRRASLVGGGLAALVVLVLGGAYGMSAAAVGTGHTAEAHPFDAAIGNAVEGERLAGMYGCTECHGPNLGGIIIVDEMPFGRVAASNLTAGAPEGALTAEEFERAVRHGVGRDGRALFIMPSAEYTYLSDQDIADIFAYVSSIPAVQTDLPARAFGPVGRALVALGKIPFQPALLAADPDARHLTRPPREAKLELGHYLTRTCIGCHGLNFAGSISPEGVATPNLTPSGPLGSWTLEDFRTFLATGRTPDGRDIDPMAMPWRVFGKAAPDEIEAMWEYLRTLPPTQSATPGT